MHRTALSALRELPAIHARAEAPHAPRFRAPAFRPGILLVLAAGLTGCQAAEPAVRIRAALDDQTAAWNRGSIDGFMEHYVRGPELTFSSGGQVQRGWETTRERFAARYPDRAAMGTLSFSDLETQLLGRDHALTLGRWRLKRAGGQLGGAFSLVWRRDGRHWRILHDHTTQDTPPP